MGNRIFAYAKIKITTITTADIVKCLCCFVDENLTENYIDFPAKYLIKCEIHECT